MSDFMKRYGPFALVTGASSGIGLAFAEELASRGLNLVLTARRRDRLEELAGRLGEEHGAQCIVIAEDLVDRAAPSRLLEATSHIDIGLVVSNAGFNMKGPFDTGSASRMEKLLVVNCHAPMLLARGFVPRLKARGSGGFLATASVEGLMTIPYSTAYSATKAFVVSLCEGLWAELQGTGVDVLALCPGATESEQTMGASAGAVRQSDLMPARKLVAEALDHLTQGPVYAAKEHMNAQFEALLAMPRADALRMVERQMRDYMRPK